MHDPTLTIGQRKVGPGHPVYVIAELSSNHGHDLDHAIRTLHAMRESGADAVKLQTYTADTLTIACDNEYFRIGGGTLWDGRTLHDLYQEAFMPWEWQPKLQAVAAELGLDFFSTPFDATAVDFLEAMAVPAHKVASFELVDIPLLRKIAATRKPVIASTGMATQEEITEAVNTLREAGCPQLALLKCTSTYPARPEDMNLRTIPDLAARFGVPVGLSDHTMGHTVPVAAVALGACIVEKHFALDRRVPGPDANFSLEPAEFKALVDAIRIAEKALGQVSYEIGANERGSRQFRRSLFVVADMKAGEAFTTQNVRSIRPGNGLPPRDLDAVLGQTAATDIQAGTPLAWSLVGT
ncbi:MAG: pseudaminic acid synthase [Opitutaceae bacterium]|nr:pseudaminic acid synthase [Opitutaceae bacterium]